MATGYVVSPGVQHETRPRRSSIGVRREVHSTHTTMNTPDPENPSRERATPVTTSGSSPYQQRADRESSRFSSKARSLEVENLVLRLFRHEPISELDYKAIQSRLRTTDEFTTRLRNELFGYILRAEDTFLQFVDVRKPLPLGLPELKRIDTFFSAEITPILTSEQRLQWFKRMVSHLAYLGSYSTWGPEHLDQLIHSTSMLSRLGTQDILSSRADVHTRTEFQHSVAAVLSLASECCSDLSAYPALFEGIRPLVMLPGHLFSSECKVSIQALHAELRAFLPVANHDLDADQKTGTFLGDHVEQGLHTAHEDSRVNRSWEVDLPSIFLEQIISDSQGADPTEEQLEQISEAQYAFSSLVCLTTQVTMTLAELSESKDRDAMQNLCYEYSFHEPEWLHYVRGLARADVQGTVLPTVMADLLRAAALDNHAIWNLVGLVAADLLLDDTGSRLIIDALASAKAGLSDEHRVSIRNKLWSAFLGRADRTSDIASIPIDKPLFKEAIKEVLARVYPEECVSSRGRE